jgi:hypothetical protein
MIGFLGLDQCKVTENSFFFDESFALKIFGYFRFGQYLWFASSSLKFYHIFSRLHIGISTSFCIKGWNSSTSRSDLFCKCSLWSELNLDFAIQVHMFQSFVGSDKRNNGPLDLIRRQKYAQSPIVFSSEISPSETIRGNVKILDIGLPDCIDEIHGNATKAKPTREE